MLHRIRIIRVSNSPSRIAALLVTAVLAAGLAGCSGRASVETTVKADGVRSDRLRLPPGSPEAEDVAALVSGNTEFAFELYGALFDRDENLLLSPHGLSTALAMTYAGAGGETGRQMAGTLRFSLPQARLHPAFNTLDQALAGSSQPGTQEPQFRIENGVWGQAGHAFLASFLDTLAGYYGAGMRPVDFGQPEEARRVINRWVSAQTANEIGELLPSGALDSETALVLTNAARLRAGWQTPFDEGATHDAAFALLDGSQVMVPTMEQVAGLGYTMRPGLQAIELPYAGGDLSMVILLPDEGGFESFARTLDTDKLDTIFGGLTPASLHLVIPKFRYSVGIEMQSALEDLGMADAFGAQADFAGIDGTRELFIDKVYHQALVDVDEAGTEASAGSAVVMARKGDPQVEQDVRVDRPFLYLIRHVETNALLFLGHVVNPAP